MIFNRNRRIGSRLYSSCRRISFCKYILTAVSIQYRHWIALHYFCTHLLLFINPRWFGAGAHRSRTRACRHAVCFPEAGKCPNTSYLSFGGKNEQIKDSRSAKGSFEHADRRSPESTENFQGL